MTARPEPGAVAERVLRELHGRFVRRRGATGANIELALEDLRAMRAQLAARAVLQQSAQAQARQGLTA